jgi:hypothetical protein
VNVSSTGLRRVNLERTRGLPQPGNLPNRTGRAMRRRSEELDRRAIIGGLRFAWRLFAAPALKQFVREETLPRCPERRRTARLRAAQPRHLLSRQLHLPDGPSRDERCRQRIGRARPRRAPRDRRLGDAGRHLDQHQRPDDYDRREERGNDQRHRAPKTGRVASAVELHDGDSKANQELKPAAITSSDPKSGAGVRKRVLSLTRPSAAAAGSRQSRAVIGQTALIMAAQTPAGP